MQYALTVSAYRMHNHRPEQKRIYVNNLKIYVGTIYEVLCLY